MTSAAHAQSSKNAATLSHSVAPEAFTYDGADCYGPGTALESWYRIEPWPNGPEAFRAVFLDGSYTGAASLIGAAGA